ncbi:MAG: hypothetical protein HYV07_14635 [Deltaproteobacteria bacterium]|nr:hypothetical protein [Deltaproteobacteria bacterium]
MFVERLTSRRQPPTRRLGRRQPPTRRIRCRRADGSLSLDADAPDDAGDAPDGSPVATLGTGCAPNTKLATIEVSDEGGARYVNATVLDAPPPWVGPPALTTNACIFHRASAGCACPTDEVCNFAGSCVPIPAPFASASVTLTGAAGNQTLTLDGSGSGWAEVSLPDDSLAVTLLADDARLITPSMSIPAVLGGLTGALGGSYDAPTSVDVSWAPVSGAHVFTHISINHHVPAPTFTECLVDGSSGSFHIGADMLTPLAVVTGLEFQGVEHVRLASAPLGSGCVEFRFTRRHYLSLF